MRNAAAPTVTNSKADGSGTGWKARFVGSDNPEAKILCVPSGVNSIIWPLINPVVNKLPALLKARPMGLVRPEANVL